MDAVLPGEGVDGRTAPIVVDQSFDFPYSQPPLLLERCPVALTVTRPDSGCVGWPGLILEHLHTALVLVSGTVKMTP